MSYDPRYAKGHRRPESEATSNSSNTSKSSPAPSEAGAPTPPTHCDDCDRPELCDWIKPGTAPCGRNAGCASPPEPPLGTTDAQPEDVAGLLNEVDGSTVATFEQMQRAIKDAAVRLEPGADRAMLYEAAFTLGNWREIALSLHRENERLATALRAATDRAEKAEAEARERKEGQEAAERLYHAAYARHATAIERAKQLPCDGDPGDLVRRAAVLSILTGEPDTHA